MKERKTFIIFLLKFILLLVLAYGAWQLLFWFLWKSEIGPDAYDNAYQRALLRQIDAIKAPNRDPEIIVFGSSYVPYGIDTKTMEEVLCEDKRTVQILGIEAAIGIPYLIDTLKESVKPGDMVVYILGESNPEDTSIMSISAALEPDKEKLLTYWDSVGGVPETYLTWRKLYALTASGPIEAVRSRLSDKEQVYRADSFDDKGNMTVERIGTQISTDVSPEDTIRYEDLEEETMEALNEFSKWCRENDVEFVIAFSPTIEGSWVEDSLMFKTFNNNVRSYMDAPVIGNFQDYELPVEYFYNHPLHLNTEGAEKYSELLATKLKIYMENGEEEEY